MNILDISNNSFRVDAAEESFSTLLPESSARAPNLKEKIVSLGGKASDKTHLPFHEQDMKCIRDTFYTMGQGMKVAVEVTLIATDKELVKPQTTVISVAGTDKGSDTAIVVRTTFSRDIFSKDYERRLDIKEILAMPLSKSWWE